MTLGRPWGSWRRLPACACLLVVCTAGRAAGAAADDLAGFSLEQLLDVEVISPSKYIQRIADAPAAVTVLRASDIRQFGYRTLADILRSVRGFYVSNDRQYSYVGVRGFSPLGDYNTRLLVLVDGYRINDNIYDTGAISGEFPLDVDLVDRVEIVRGPGSSVYGSNALFGIVNVITRRGRDFNGGEAVAGTGSYRDREGRLTWGRHLESGLDILLSASGLRNDGPALSFPDLGSSSGITTRKTDFEHRRQLFAKLEYGTWNLTLMDSRRDKGIATGAYGIDFNDTGNRIIDDYSNVNLGYFQTLDNGVEASGRIYAGNYAYRGYYLYSGLFNRDVSEGSWWGGEVRFVTVLHGHKLVYGADYQQDMRQNQRNFDLNPYYSRLDSRRDGSRYGIHVQDDFSLAERWLLSAGLRYDHTSIGSGNTSPRLGLIHAMDKGAILKLLYGSAYRTPNVYERYYDYPGQQLANPALRPERVRTYEIVWEKDIEPGLHLVGSVYRYRIQNWIVAQPQIDPSLSTTVYQFTNQAPTSAKGFEFEADRQWQNGSRLRASYAAQFAPEHSATGINQAPRHLVKTNVSLPLGNPSWRAGMEYQYTSSRITTNGRLGGYSLANATLLYRYGSNGSEVALGVYNLFDRRYADPNADTGLPNRESLAQDGRTWRLRFVVPF